MDDYLTEEELEADRIAIKRFQERLAQDLKDAEERGRVATRIEWRGHLRKVIARERALRAERDEARAILAEIAKATADQCFLFMDEKGHDDWPTAVAWLKQHIGLTPEQSMLEQHQEAINNWRAYARAYQADNAALFDAIYDWSRYHSAGEGKEEDALLASLAASHPGAPFLALLVAARAYRDAVKRDTIFGIADTEQTALFAAIEAMDEARP